MTSEDRDEMTMQSPSQGLQIIAVEPATGNPGQRVLVTLRTAAELDIRGYHIAIGNVDTSVTFNSSRRDGDADYVELVALVPDLARLTSETAVPLTVYATSGNGATYGETATFLYSPAIRGQRSPPLPQKRRGDEPTERREAPAQPTSSPMMPTAGPSQPRSPGSPQMLLRPAPASSKAELHFAGELNTMAMGWTRDEFECRRRLVQFWRQQQGNVINCTFKPITPDQYVPDAIVISCVFHEAKNECFVTSVDTIYLLEALVGIRFTVEEKNRIRRNLEGFKPFTVSKSKADSAEFFRLIMAFGSPKPRSIEKDLKVFTWKTLGSALKKIISKYSATYASPDDPLPALGNEAAIPGSRLPPEPISPRSAASIEYSYTPPFLSSAPPSYPPAYNPPLEHQRSHFPPPPLPSPALSAGSGPR